MKKILVALSIFASTLLFSQQKKVTINWSGSKIISTDYSQFVLPSFTPEDNYVYSLDKGLEYVDQWEETSYINENTVSISNVKYSPISKKDLKDIDLTKISSELKFSLKNSIARKKNYGFLSVSMIMKDGNDYKKLESFTISYKKANSIYSKKSRQPVVNSVLSSGAWYKFAIDKSGVFKLSKQFLNDLGINTNELDPKKIRIFGNGGNILPYTNSINVPIDPTENAIKVVGEEDGVFNDEDYVLFYGEGPKGYNQASNTHVNLYTDTTYYYINVNDVDGKRIENFVQPTGATTLNVSTFQDYQFHEIDEFNLKFAGRRWFGDKFDTEVSKEYLFNFPNLVTTTPINLKVVAVSTSSASSRMRVRLNSTEVANVNIIGGSSLEGVFSGPVSSTSDNVTLNLDYDKSGVPTAIGYIDYISLEATRNLIFSGNQFRFYNNEATSLSGVGEYTLSNATQVSEIWDISDKYNVQTIQNLTGSTITFKAPLGELKTFITVTDVDFYVPLILASSTVNNQNIKGTVFQNNQGGFQDVDYLMLTPSSHLVQAERLAEINRNKYNMNVKVYTIESIYSEFNTGNSDISAIRNFVRYVYENASNEDNRVKYLCLFGDSSFDYKEGRIAGTTNKYNFPTWNAYSSFDLTSSYVSDDFYGIMDLNEGELNTSDKLDIAVGRILADTPLRAKQMVDKIERYYSKETLGSWRNNFVVISDDVDIAWEKVIQETTDEIGDTVEAERPFMNVVKIHSDSFQQESSSGGDRYPEAKNAINNAIENGALVVNYFGHGGEDGFAKERIFRNTDALALRNTCKMNCLVTVTCEYSRFDNPLRETGGELIYWNANGGAIGLISTTRQIFVNVGIAFNKKISEYLFSYNDNDSLGEFEYPTMAEALRLSKVDPLITNISQKRLVFFIGDPAMKLAIPEPSIRLTRINDDPITGPTDILKGLSHAKLNGEVTDEQGNVLTNYNGKIVATIYDKDLQKETLANDGIVLAGQTIKLYYKTLGEVIFRGQATVVNGQFEVGFVVPKDVGIPIGAGKASFYAFNENTITDKSGASINTVQIGGINENAEEDNEGPVINLFMNDENFVSGGITNSSPTLIAKLQDENGINTASGIGHDIVAIIDGDEVNPFILNNYYTTDLDVYTSGSLSFPFRGLKPGLHTLTLKAWDVYNNSSTSELQFMVFDENESLVIDNVLNYPNPFVNYTEFWFNHNSSEILDISVQIFTFTGKLVRTINGKTTGIGSKSVASASRDITWDGRDDFGNKIGKGTYIYKLKVRSEITNKTTEKIEKLVIL